MARISAVITSYNSEKYLCDAIASVLDQSRPVDEVILVDDGSTDGSVETARAFAGDLVRIITQANRGPGGARNRGIEAATGDYLAFLDADDLWQREKTAIQLAMLEADPGLGLASGDRDWIDLRSGQTQSLKYHGRSEADVRDARLVHQLRRGGYLLERIAPLISQVRAAGGLEPLEAALHDWRGRLSARGRAMLTGAAELEAYLRERG